MKEFKVIYDDTTHFLKSDETLAQVFKNQEGEESYPLVAAYFNNELYSLNSCIEVNGAVKPVYLDTTVGIRLYRRTLCFVLEMAARELFPSHRLFLSHSLGHSYYYHLLGNRCFSEEDLDLIKKRMKAIINEDHPIIPDLRSWKEARNYFEQMNQNDTVLLLKSSNSSKVRINRSDKYMALRHEILLPSTGFLKFFDIMPYSDGFLLRYPPSKTPDKLSPFKDEPLLFSIYSEYKAWGKILNADTVGKMNSMVADKKQSEHFIRVCESLHNKKIAKIADSILERKGDVKVILIAGPSSSGKTTFTKKLCIQLQVVGFNPVMVSLDDYYLPPDQVPEDEFGKPDLEALGALDVPLLNKNLLQLFKGEETEFPVFDFKKGGRQEQGRILKMDDRSILVMEGIHGLNRDLTPSIDPSAIFKVYISALTQLNLDDHTRIATTDNRLIRRMVRDHQFRNYDAEKTISIWPSVRRGEEKNIFPNQDRADAAFNSALDYELAVLRMYAEPLLKSISPDREVYAEAQRLLNFINNFSPLPSNMVPTDSILREFIGDSSFKY
ncbi:MULTISPECIES: nucleoside kinase [unclassified Oceanispirochaeta]|uniref:nucleoside kinase n=1 Tax=unclassified Oceanispirochaeta TaxID=2635722 RepID=UPI000E095A9E|nr:MULTISPECIES: nucleoside kinase [unclassified Oceanispirochaeta]MBF9015661.1 nucleoside kinase [Oceanispirochaeta sp. M2]NPD73435.1 nucleoside kinase [Oceanispirochaeta sp. M1]RDG30908.1 nucleoside kinase [Oceanispirochaeta sp. M1]